MLIAHKYSFMYTDSIYIGRERERAVFGVD